MGGAAFLPLPFFGGAALVGLHFRFCLVWCCFPFLGGVAVSPFLLGGVPLSLPPPFGMLLLLSFLFLVGGAAFPPPFWWCCLPPSTLLGLCVPFGIELNSV